MAKLLQTLIEEHLSKSNKTADFRPGIGNVLMQDDSDGSGPYIANWDQSLGPPPDISDGFSASHLRRLKGREPQ